MMKDRAKILGFIAAIIMALSAFAKVNHIKGASLGLIIALGLLFPIYLIINIVKSDKEKKRFVPTLLLGGLILVYTIGMLFVIMNWTNGFEMANVGFILSLVSLCAIYFLEVGKDSESRTFSAFFVVTSIVAVSLIYVSAFRGISGNLIDGFGIANTNATSTKNMLVQINANRVFSMDSTNNSILDIHKEAEELVGYIENLKMDIAVAANNDEAIEDYNNIRYKSNISIAQHLLFDQNRGEDLKQHIERYSSKFATLNLDEETKSIIIRRLTTQDPPPLMDGTFQTWLSSRFEGQPIMSVISVLSSLQVDVLACEMLALQGK